MRTDIRVDNLSKHYRKGCEIKDVNGFSLEVYNGRKTLAYSVQKSTMSSHILHQYLADVSLHVRVEGV